MTSYVLCAAALVLIAFIMLCRANDLRWQESLVMRVRLCALIGAGVAPWGIIGFDYYLARQVPTPFTMMLLLSVSVVFVTTPKGIPFWRWFSKGEETA